MAATGMHAREELTMKSDAATSEDSAPPRSRSSGVADRDARARKISDRLAYLGTVEDGWFEGRGVALDEAGLRWLDRQMTGHYAGTDLPLPFLCPSEPGGVIGEWSLERHLCLIEIDLEARTGSWMDVDRETHDGIEEEILDLDSATGWQWLIDRLRRFVSES